MIGDGAKDAAPADVLPWEALLDCGVLWMINATIFHPRGFAMAVDRDPETDELRGWTIVGDGTEPWMYADSMNERLKEKFEAFEAMLDELRP